MDPSIGHPNFPRLRLEQEVNDTYLANCMAVAALTWVVYDMLLSVGREVRLVWSRWYRPRGWRSRRLYVVVRYLSVMGLAGYVGVNNSYHLTPQFCQAWFYILVVYVAIITLVPDVMVLIRINSVYGWRTSIVSCTSVLFLVQVATGIGTGMSVVAAATITAPSPSSPPPGCLLTGIPLHPKITLAAWIPSIAAQCIYLILMLHTLFRAMQDLGPEGWPSAAGLGQVRRLIPTMMVFIRHGVVYFVLAILAKVVNAVIVITVSGPLQGLGIPWMMALYPVLITRLYLEMVQYLYSKPRRVAVSQDVNGEAMRFSATANPDPSNEGCLGQITFAPPSSVTEMLMTDDDLF